MLTWCGTCVELDEFQLEVVVAISPPATGALLYQSAIDRPNDWVLPSVYVIVPVPDAAPNPAAPRNPRSVPDPERSMIWPSATTLSGAPTAVGHVKVVPPRVAWPPGLSGVGDPTARACAEKLSPVPSKLAAAGFELSLIPALS